MLSPSEICALAGAFKSKDVDAAKDKLTEGTVSPVDFTVRISGHVQKGHGTPEITTKRVPSVNFANLGAFCGVLKALNIGPGRLREALRSLPVADLKPDAKLEKIFGEVAAERAAELPAEPHTTAARRGSVSAQVNTLKV